MMAVPSAGLTRYFVADEIAEKCESIVECWTNILGTRGLEANGGVDAACFAVDVCCHEIICNALSSLDQSTNHILKKCVSFQTQGSCCCRKGTSHEIRGKVYIIL